MQTSAVRRRQRPQQGYTLVELLCCLLLLAILSAIAVPSYQQAWQRARRSDAHLSLLRIHAQQERRYAQLQRYSAVLGHDSEQGLGVGVVSEAGHYALSLKLSDQGQHYRAIATARGAQQADSACQTLWIDDTGERGADSARCWP
jgi:type IV pilus assembly protein PilE